MATFTATIKVRGFETIRQTEAKDWKTAVKQFRKYTTNRLKLSDSDVILDISVKKLNDTSHHAAIARIKEWTA